MNKRISKIVRNTNETQIELELNIDGTGKYEVQTDIGFLTHMMELFSKHSLCDLKLTARGDVQYDDHHLIEDVGIALGLSIKEAMQDKKGIKRYGYTILPMDEVLCIGAIDLSGRYAFETNYQPIREKVNDFSTEMMKHFFQSIAVNAMMNLHLYYLNPGENEHHRLEAAFKAFARALRQACEVDPRTENIIPSTKGVI